MNIFLSLDGQREGPFTATQIRPGGTIIIAKNDGSVVTVKLEFSKGQAVGPRKTGSGVDIFTQASGNTPQQILNIATSTQP